MPCYRGASAINFHVCYSETAHTSPDSGCVVAFGINDVGQVGFLLFHGKSKFLLVFRKPLAEVLMVGVVAVCIKLYRFNDMFEERVDRCGAHCYKVRVKPVGLLIGFGRVERLTSKIISVQIIS
jgi:hypothetical protein